MEINTPATDWIEQDNEAALAMADEQERLYEDQHGHTWYLQVASRGHSHVAGEPVPQTCRDANYVHPPWTAEIRAHSLSSALRRAADLPLSQWGRELEGWSEEDWMAWRARLQRLDLPTEDPALLVLTVGEPSTAEELYATARSLGEEIESLGLPNVRGVILTQGQSLASLDREQLASLGLLIAESPVKEQP